ncbi:hypothetical protein [Candidatus Caldatribacterium sp.]|uniref:hypothetical protein n=1 Tax=Candidatus Caldatribacterium sp. TaxID=2282143 RepID=UPI0029982670|nr:DUF4380 domain-containing protein [Candidatus Caldatribacterium sp.]MDW8080615.1 hypothetical protein [Candidatus Calescibacterium sp.]
MVIIEKVSRWGWENNIRMTNGTLEVIATTDVGPRVLHLSLVGERNIFRILEEECGRSGGDEWHIFGGHRLWHAPEANPRSYCPDNHSVRFVPTAQGGVFSQSVEPLTGIEKEMEIILDLEGNHLTVLHRLTNRGVWPVELAPWALSVMEQGGIAIIPQEPYQSWSENLLPVRPLVLWGYTDMSDPRWRWGRKYVTLRQDPRSTSPNKAGFGNSLGWGAYLFEGYLFVKYAPRLPGMSYPDMGSSFEVYTDHRFLELETLGPLVRLAPQETVEHKEDWFLFKGVFCEDSDESIDTFVKPLVEKALERIQGQVCR